MIAKYVDKPLNYEMVDFHSDRPGHDLRYGLDGTVNYLIWDLNYTVKSFQELLINNRDKKISFTLLRIGHAEYCFFKYLIPTDKRQQGKNIAHILSRHYTGKQTHEDYKSSFESLINVDYITTQIGYDYKQWLNDIQNFKKQYAYYKNKNKIDILFKNLSLFNENYINYSNTEVHNMPLDIVYGLIANKWFFRTFKNKIGIIGSSNKLDLIKELMKYEAYKKYIENDYFTDYIPIQQRSAMEDKSLENTILEQVQSSTCDIFLCGMGVSKLKIFHKLKKVKNCIYIDVGYGIDAIAGLANYTRPYFGSWQNYKLKNYDYKTIDFCGSPSWNNVIML